ncbi:MAG: alpha/beta fold hydrolase [Myxococcales bacterium]
MSTAPQVPRDGASREAPAPEGASRAAATPDAPAAANDGAASPGGTAEGFTEGADGTRIHYSVVGQGGPTLLCCDGIGCDGFAWKYVVRDFAKTHRIVRWHYRGHGRSGIPEDRSRVGFDDISDDLQAVLRATSTRQAIFLGHSMGVQVALEQCRREPARVLGLVLLCGSHGQPLDTFHETAVLKAAVPAMTKAAERWPEASRMLWRLFAGGEAAYQVATRLEVNGKLVRREDFAPYFQHLSKMDPRLFLNMLLHAGAHSAYDSLPEVKVPTLIVAGTHDTFTPYWLSEQMRDRIPGAEMLTVPGGTHVAPIEQPELIGLRLERFLSRIGTGSQPQKSGALRDASR